MSKTTQTQSVPYTGRIGLATCTRCKCERRFREVRQSESLKPWDFFPIPWMFVGKLFDRASTVWISKKCNHVFIESEFNDLNIDDA